MTRLIARATVAALLAASPAPLLAQTAFDVPAVEDGTLRAIAGREDLNQVSQSRNTSTVTDNSVGDNSLTGEIRIDDQAFQNLSGLALLNVNTGNNVAINSAMNVNISINPGQ